MQSEGDFHGCLEESDTTQQTLPRCSWDITFHAFMPLGVRGLCGEGESAASEVSFLWRGYECYLVPKR